MTITRLPSPVAARDGDTLTSPRARRRPRSVGGQLWWFVLPALAVYAYVVIVPSAQGIATSFTDWSFTRPEPEFVGWDNYARVFQGDAAPAALRTLWIAFVAVVAQNLLGLGLALLLHGKVFGRNVLRTIIFAPMVVSPLVVGYLFKYIFGPPGVGAANAVLAAFGRPEVDFLGNPSSALWIIITTVVWQVTGATMVIYLAGLQGVPQELDEAAALDGAGYWKRFWYVTRPLLAPAITLNLMIGLIGGLKLFDQIFSITAGGPGNKTQTISTLLYQVFTQFGEYGRAAAMAVVLAIAIGFLASIQFTVLRRQEGKS
ncbi:carbohydrate ABC transporter permease [Nocardioides sp. WG-D5]